MQINQSKKDRFHLKKEVQFKVKSKELRIQKGTISKLKQRATYGVGIEKKNETKSIKVKKKPATTFESSFNKKKEHSSKKQGIKEEKSPLKDTKKNTEAKKKAKDKVASNEQAIKKKKAKEKKKVKKQEKNAFFSKSLKQVSAKKAVDRSLNALNQEEENEGLQYFQNSTTQGNRLIKTTKKIHGFTSKNEKYAKSVTNGKLDDLRFLGKKEQIVTSKNYTKKPLKKSFKRRKTAKQATRKVRETIVQSITRMASAVLSSNPIGWIIAAVSFLLLFLFGFLLLLNNQNSSASDSGEMYVEHWDGKDAYHSSLLAQRYGIKEEQIDSFIKNEGFTVDSRATGKEFLRLQALSGIDVRMLVAFAQMESSYGTAGVAHDYPKANIFGYGAFDNDPNQGASWDNTRAVSEFRSTQIDSYGNTTIAIMDERAKAFHNNTLKPGQFVYWTKLDAGKPRAAIAEKLDKWIDDHGGTPKPPGGYGPIGGGGGAGLAVLDKLLGKEVSGEFGGITGQCYAVTAYYAHSITPEIILRNGVKASEIGNDYPWDKWKWTVVKEPKYKDIRPGDIINFHAGANMGSWVADSLYGHTGVVGKILGNNQFLLYDQNPGPLKTWTVTYVSGGISSVIHPPKK
ncbi:CHAP domain-containing protein [Enterococcus faecalis]|uniref:CHAP domain-containing protein n=1 Tax=Enterococcus faecalis TaxID=1351 RepID=UPI00188362A0|nr:CHAP domain-containing protein [Enterococcus faecalis]MBF0006615.1 CHAP domain-containing protein [Enterococcus faecalis]MBF0009298.1 CHAP domain-containing protein [Enterococcus faecalis]MBF0018480.1 CHAP domain-containing protein [Enterococcus faecalis]